MWLTESLFFFFFLFHIKTRQMIIQWTLVLTNMVFNEFLVTSNKISRSLHFWLKKKAKKNTAFNEFLVISNRNIGSFLKFCHVFSEQYHISEFRSLFATFESLKSTKFPMHTVIPNSNSKYFHWNVSSFQIKL